MIKVEVKISSHSTNNLFKMAYFISAEFFVSKQLWPKHFLNKVYVYIHTIITNEG